MKANVRFDEDGEPSFIKVTEQYGHTVKFTLDGTTAVATVVEPGEGESAVYMDTVHRFMDYVESLPFVQATALDEYEDAEVSK